MSPALRNGLVILVLAGLVFAAPGGQRGGYFVQGVLSVGISVAMVLIAARMYREHRSDIFGLDDRWRGVFYGSIAMLVFLLAGRYRMWQTDAGLLLWFMLVGGVVYALVVLWRHYRTLAY